MTTIADRVRRFFRRDDVNKRPPRWRFNLLPRRPDFVIGTDDRPYMRRWYLIRTPLFGINLHNFRRDDDDRALHDHPWPSVSIVLRGGYYEAIPVGDPAPANAAHVDHRLVWRGPGSVVFRRAAAPHRVVLPKNPFTDEPRAAWTVFLTGRKQREWGFHCPQGWKHWRDFTKPGARGEIGPGCGD